MNVTHLQILLMALLIPLMALLIPLTARGAESGAPLASLESDIRAATVERAGKRAESLTRDPRLVAIARDHSRTMFHTGELGHKLAGRGPAERLARHHRSLFGLVSENVGYHRQTGQQADVAASLLDGWMASPGHRANILADYRLFEVGCFGTATTVYCTQLFVREPASLGEPIAYRQSPGARLVLTLSSGPEDPVGRRISIDPVDGRSGDSGAELQEGEAELTAPAAPGLHQLQLWTPEADDPGHYRVIGGPFVCIVADSDTHETRTGWCDG